jgi:hypothetical protein
LGEIIPIYTGDKVYPYNAKTTISADVAKSEILIPPFLIAMRSFSYT